jgi:hypothetical protein
MTTLNTIQKLDIWHYGSFTLARYRGRFRTKLARLVMKIVLNKMC